jgi:hypothetical protein
MRGARSTNSAHSRATVFDVMRGLDPRIHDEVQARKVVLPLPRKGLMDCRVKPGNDGGEVDGPNVTGSTLI